MPSLLAEWLKKKEGLGGSCLLKLCNKFLPWPKEICRLQVLLNFLKTWLLYPCWAVKEPTLTIATKIWCHWLLMPPMCQSHCKLQFLWRSKGAKLCKASCCHMKLLILCGLPILLIGCKLFFLVEKVLWWSSGRSFSIILLCKAIGFWTKMIGWLLQFQPAYMEMLCRQ